MNELEGVGETGETVESDGHTHETNCLNCGTFLTGAFCHACGQHAYVHRTLSAFFHDLAHGVFHFEGKVWRTLPLLAWRPGELTRDYIEGKRARFVSPMALFLFSVFLMFAVLGMTGSINVPTSTDISSEMTKSVAQDAGELRKLQVDRAKALAAGDAVAEIDRKIEAKRDELSLEQRIAKDGAVAGSAMRISDDVPAWLRRPIEKAGKNPELLFYKLRSNAYKFSWALIPLSVPFLWLLFPFSRRFRLYDHIVFVTYSLCFMTLLVCAAAIAAAAGAPSIAELALLVPPIHIYRQLRGAYALSGWGALWRTVFLVTAAAMVLALFIVALVGLGLFD